MATGCTYGAPSGPPISAGNGQRRVHDVVHDARENAGLWSRHWEQGVDPGFCGTSSACAPLWVTWALRSVELEEVPFFLCGRVVSYPLTLTSRLTTGQLTMKPLGPNWLPAGKPVALPLVTWLKAVEKSVCRTLIPAATAASVHVSS